jgi:hypothetical protein
MNHKALVMAIATLVLFVAFGKVKETTAIAKMKPMLREFKRDVSTGLSKQGVGECFLTRSGNVTPIRSQASVVTTEQLSEHEIIQFAATSRDQCGSAKTLV